MARSGNSGDSEEVSATIMPRSVFNALRMRMEVEAELDSDEINSVFYDGVEKIISADTEEEMWDADDLLQIGGKDLADVEQEILGYAIKCSRNDSIKTMFKTEDGRNLYLLVKAVRLETGEEFTWNTSAPYVVSKILWLGDRGKFPKPCVIRATDLGAGQAVIKLKPIPKRVVQGTL